MINNKKKTLHFFQYKYNYTYIVSCYVSSRDIGNDDDDESEEVSWTGMGSGLSKRERETLAGASAYI